MKSIKDARLLVEEIAADNGVFTEEMLARAEREPEYKRWMGIVERLRGVAESATKMYFPHVSSCTLMANFFCSACLTIYIRRSRTSYWSASRTPMTTGTLRTLNLVLNSPSTVQKLRCSAMRLGLVMRTFELYVASERAPKQRRQVGGTLARRASDSSLFSRSPKKSTYAPLRFPSSLMKANSWG